MKSLLECLSVLKSSRLNQYLELYICPTHCHCAYLCFSDLSFGGVWYPTEKDEIGIYVCLIFEAVLKSKGLFDCLYIGLE